jgi:Xaa-Pro aminopeptidase
MQDKYIQIPVETHYLHANNKTTKNAPIWPSGYTIIKQEAIKVADYLELYNEIGSLWGWTAFLFLTEEELNKVLNAATEHVYYLYFNDNIAGYFELREHEQTIELLYLGLKTEFIGLGLGQKLMQQARFEASMLDFDKFELHTCEYDHKNALNTYIKAGFTVEKKTIDWEYYPAEFIKKHKIMTINERLEDLRALMQEEGIDAYVITGTDPHLSEYVPDRWQIRKWISGFSGSAGRIVITQEFAGLWTDSRYFLQAEEQLKGTKFELVKLKVPHTPEYIEWLQIHIKTFGNVGLDDSLISYQEGTMLYNALSQKKVTTRFGLDLVSKLWKNRPEFPLNKPFILDEKFAGESALHKIKRLRDTMKQKNLDYFLVSALDEIAWLFNIRGNDVSYNPVSYAYALIGENELNIYVKEEKLSSELKKHYESLGAKIQKYEAINEFVNSIYMGARLGIDSDKTNKMLVELVPNYTQLKLIISPIAELKSVKNKTEISNTHKAMVKDGVALTKFFRWVEEIAPKETETEYTLGVKLAEFRAEQENFVSESFNPIVGFNANGAIVHYSASEETAKQITGNGILLVDSGGQYYEGTTDVTRTIALGDFPDEAKTDFTLVLKGHIQLAMVTFPAGTAGNQLDILARMPLWKLGKNYGHGTGHGVGYFLNVHEGPQAIRPFSAQHVPMQEGMITSNEPGFYPAGKYGIRIENLILTVKDKNITSGDFLTFNTMTLFPIDCKLIKKELLNPDELNWLNEYHNKVYTELSPYLSEAERQWVASRTKAL